MQKSFLFVFLILGVTNLFGQSYSSFEVIYTNSSISNPDGIDAYLRVDDKLVEFSYYRKKSSNKNNGITFAIPFLKYTNQFEFSSKKISENRELSNGVVLYAEWDNDIEWTITDEQKTILGYTVTKAYTDSFDSNPGSPFGYGKAIAWFTTDIPIPAGPARYNGLPGLILELTYENFNETYLAKDIKMKEDKFVPKILDKKNKVDKYDVIYVSHKNPGEIRKIKK